MLLGLILLAALLIPTVVVIIDGPIGRALARRLEGPPQVTQPLTDIAKRVELLEGEVDDLNRAVETLKEENAFLQRLLEDAPSRPSLPPPPKP